MSRRTAASTRQSTRVELEGPVFISGCAYLAKLSLCEKGEARERYHKMTFCAEAAAGPDRRATPLPRLDNLSVNPHPDPSLLNNVCLSQSYYRMNIPQRRTLLGARCSPLRCTRRNWCGPAELFPAIAANALTLYVEPVTPGALAARNLLSPICKRERRVCLSLSSLRVLERPTWPG